LQNLHLIRRLLLLANGLTIEEETSKMLIWSVALYGAENLALRSVDQKHLESLEMWCWRRMEKIVGTIM
jgi:hypothetical protein